MLPTLTPRHLPVFVCYAEEDNEDADPKRRWLNRLLQHLQPLVRRKQVGVWSNRDIAAGIDWKDAIQQSLQAARVAVLLVSPAFLASDQISNCELPMLLRRCRDEGLLLLPLILRPCYFDQPFRYPDPEHGPEEFSLASLQAVNPPDRPLSRMTADEQDEVLVALAKRLQAEVLSATERQVSPVVPHPSVSAPDPIVARLPASGDRIGKYRVDRLLGQGGMGMVYAATHDVLGPVAIKMLHPHLSADPLLAMRFLDEARVAFRLHHPGVVRVYDCDQLANGNAYMVMEYLSGETLGARLGEKPGPQPAILPLLQQVAAALAAVHQGGVIHRDLKPDNVMIIKDAAMPGGERVKLLDFGIAKLSLELSGAAGRLGATRAGVMMGTPLYMAPEQGEDASGVTDRADVYSLGVMLYRVLAGKLPFAADTLPALLGVHVRREQPVPLRHLGIAPFLSDLVAEMLGYDPAGRPSMTGAKERIEQALREPVPSGTRSPSSVPIKSPPLSPRKPLARSALRPAMIPIGPGEFWMGSPETDGGHQGDELRPQVRISRWFLISATAVTQEQYQAVTGKNPSNFKGSPRLPVEQVSFFDVATYCNHLSEKEGLLPCYRIDGENVTWPDGPAGTGYRLPTEAEWEYAARAGQDTLYAGSSDPQEVAWYDANSDGKTHPVGQKKANVWGLYDMSGNVWEWVWDWYATGYYKTSPSIDPTGPESGSDRVARGGSWDSDPFNLRVASRRWYRPVGAFATLGFRLSRSLP